jgi:hypothetical protein
MSSGTAPEPVRTVRLGGGSPVPCPSVPPEAVVREEDKRPTSRLLPARVARQRRRSRRPACGQPAQGAGLDRGTGPRLAEGPESRQPPPGSTATPGSRSSGPARARRDHPAVLPGPARRLPVRGRFQPRQARGQQAPRLVRQGCRTALQEHFWHPTGLRTRPHASAADGRATAAAASRVAAVKETQRAAGPRAASAVMMAGEIARLKPVDS